jgi:MFS family permease
LNILPSYTDYFSLTTTTLALNTASVWLGGCITGFYGLVTDAIGRKNALLLAAIITIIGVILQTASQNIAMFVIARIIIGFGTAASASAGKWHLLEKRSRN